MTAQQPTSDDAKRYCPLNSMGCGDNQTSLCREYHEAKGTCLSDYEECHYATCSILQKIMKQPSQPRHCEHECVCPDYKASHSDFEEDPDPCTLSCYYRAPHTSSTKEQQK